MNNDKTKIAIEIQTISSNLIIAYEKKYWSYVLEQTKRLKHLQTEIMKLK